MTVNLLIERFEICVYYYYYFYYYYYYFSVSPLHNYHSEVVLFSFQVYHIYSLANELLFLLP